MSPVDSKFIEGLHLGQDEATQFTYNEQTGLRFKRRFTEEGKSPFDMVEYEMRSSVIREPDGTVVFELNDIEIPKQWSQVATDIMAQKYFRKAGVPQFNRDGSPKLNADGSPMLGAETSVKQTIHRLVGTWRFWGERYGYFATGHDAQIFYDELVVMLLRQMAAPNSPQWFNTGLNWAHGINGPAQGHYYVDPDTGVMTQSADAYTHPQPHACARYNTKLMTETGLVNIGDVVEQKNIGLRIFDGDRFVSVQAVKNNGVKHVYRATLKNGNFIEFTDDHRIWTSDKRSKDGGMYEWKELKEILGNKVQQIARKVASVQTLSLQISAHATVGAHNNTAQQGWPVSPMSTQSETFQSYSLASEGEHVMSESVIRAALAGYVIGDGYYGKYNKNKKTTLFGAITINDDEYAAVTSWFTALFGAYTVVTRKEVGELYRIVKRDSKDVDEYVGAYELNQSSRTAHIPDIIFVSSQAEKSAFLRSLFQADGCVRMRTENGRNSGDIVLTSISDQLVHDVQLLLLDLGIYSNVSVCNDAREDRHTAWQLTIAYASEREKYENLIGFISEEKKEKLSNLNFSVDGKKKQTLSEETVVSIDYIGKEEVYDIQTESSKFLANGVVVHNCFIQSVSDNLVNDGGIMDLWIKEARLFKYGSGTGTNFSTLRGRGEPLSGGGKSSGLMSWLKIGDRAAGAIKSGGTTRRAAKMVIVDLDHPDVRTFINWKVQEEKKVAALIAAGYPSDYEGEAYETVSGQNSNNSVRVPNRFMEMLKRGGNWEMKWRTDGTVCETVAAQTLWDEIAFAAWACADPGLQFDDNINEWHTSPQSGKIRGSNPCSEYLFLDNTACNLASLNLAHFFDTESTTFDIDGFKHGARLWTVVLEISVLMAQYPSREIAQGSYDFRTLGLGYANIGSLLMTAGIPYESEEAYAFTGSVTALMTAESYKTSAEMARTHGAFPKYHLNKDDMQRVMRNHRRAAFNAPDSEYEKLTIKPKGIDPQYAPAYLLAAARESWNDAVEMGEQYGYRNAQTTLLAPTGTIGLLMDCSTTGVEPDFALVKFKKLAGGGYFKIANEAVPVALTHLGYTEAQVKDIIDYMRGSGDITSAPHINAESLKAKGFTDEDIKSVNKALGSAFEMQFAFNVWTLGEDCMKRAGFSPEEYNHPKFNMLKGLGFTSAEINAANEYVCGTMTIEGAPHLKESDYKVFDCANKCGKKGERYIHWRGHVRQMAAAQPFLSGAISKTINMPHEATITDVKEAYEESWKLCLKAVALYRDGSKLSQPLNTGSDEEESSDAKAMEDKPETQAMTTVAATQPVPAQSTPAPAANGEASSIAQAIEQASALLQQHVPDSYIRPTYENDGSIKEHRIYLHGEKHKLPAKRSGITIATNIGKTKVWLRTGEYPNGQLAEIFIDLYKEGTVVKSMMNMFAVSISMALQYGVPLDKLVNKFTFTRFEPAGMTDHPNVKICTSVIDFVFRVLGMEYLGRTDFVQVQPKGIQLKKFEQLSKVAETHVHQKTLEIEAPVDTPVEGQTALPTLNVEDTSVKTEADKMLGEMMGDAPACPTCGHITVRNGSCYKCLNCGDSLGCS